jgi:hypothetical protein
MPTRGRMQNKPRNCPLTVTPTRRLSKTPLPHQSDSSSDERQRFGPVFVRALHLQAKIGLNPARDADKGANSQQTSQLPSDCLSYPSPIQDPVSPTKRVVFGRTATLQPRLFPCLTPASENRVQPSSGFRQGGDSQQTSQLSSDSLPYPSSTQDNFASPKRFLVGRTATLMPVFFRV